MYKKIIILFTAILIAVPVMVFAGGSSNTCATKYPIVLSHGMGTQAKVVHLIDYWWEIPNSLEDQGARVYITSVNAMDTSAAKGLAWKQQVLQILAISGASKVNVIGHSHGGIYTRYAITNLGMAGKVASLTTIASPHRGSVIADMIMKVIPNSMEPLVGDILDLVMSLIMGDTNGNSVGNGYELIRSNMINVFNPNTPNVSGVYYQSYAYKIKNILGGGMMGITWLAMKPYEGDNDGLVSITSAQWGNFRGVFAGNSLSSGINHMAAVGMFFGLPPIPGFDCRDHFVSIVSDLKKRGL
jgi:triacylglycerol lipase